jgi:hypothetical protein
VEVAVDDIVRSDMPGVAYSDFDGGSRRLAAAGGCVVIWRIVAVWDVKVDAGDF